MENPSYAFQDQTFGLSSKKDKAAQVVTIRNNISTTMLKRVIQEFPEFRTLNRKQAKVTSLPITITDTSVRSSTNGGWVPCCYS
jgi:hypothetical protein